MIKCSPSLVFRVDHTEGTLLQKTLENSSYGITGGTSDSSFAVLKGQIEREMNSPVFYASYVTVIEQSFQKNFVF